MKRNGLENKIILRKKMVLGQDESNI